MASKEVLFEAVNQCAKDQVKLPTILEWKADVMIENDLRFDPAACGPGLFISDENTHLRKNTMEQGWRTCRLTCPGWTQGIHYWSLRLLDCGPNNYIMIGIVTSNFDTGAVVYPGNTADSYSLYVHNGYKYNKEAVVFTTDLPRKDDVIGVLLDLEARTLTFFKNGYILGTAYGQLPVHGTSIKYYPAIGMYQLGQWVTLIKTVKN